MSTIDRRVILTAVCIGALAAGVTLVGCGGGGGGDGTRDSVLRVLATDAPIDPSEVTSAIVQVSRIDVHSSGTANSGFMTIFDEQVDPPIGPIDLTDLQNGVTTQLVQANLPAGTYRQVRLYFSDASIELSNGNHYAVGGGQTGPLRLTSQAQSGLKVFIDPPVQVQGGLTATLLMDFDLSKTFRPIPASDPMNAASYQLGPVIRAVNQTATGDVSGTVTDATTTDPVEGVDVYILPPGETDPALAIAHAQTAADGAYKVLGLPPGSYDVMADDAGTRSATVSATIVAGNETVADIVLP